MTNRPRTPRYAACLFAFIATLCCVTSFAQEQRIGTIKGVLGDVMVVRGDSTQPVRPGLGLLAQDKLVTGKQSAATIGMQDGTSITVGPSSTVKLTSFQFEPTQQEGSMALALLKGSIRFITGLLGKRHPENVQITTPAATVSIRGTDFILEAP